MNHQTNRARVASTSPHSPATGAGVALHRHVVAIVAHVLDVLPKPDGALRQRYPAPASKFYDLMRRAPRIYPMHHLTEMLAGLAAAGAALDDLLQIPLALEMWIRAMYPTHQLPTRELARRCAKESGEAVAAVVDVVALKDTSALLHAREELEQDLIAVREMLATVNNELAARERRGAMVIS
jgi:hypothetical protein